jgi:ubiquinol-cytochrome c reductase iron-sulfur subunit
MSVDRSRQDPAEHRPDPGERRAELGVLALFGLTFMSGIALLIVYALGGQTQAEGLLLTVCLGALGAGIVLWSHALLPNPIEEEERHPLASSPEERRQLEAALAAEGSIGRRKLLVRALFGALAGLGAALAVPVLSLGPSVGRSLHVTTWRNGSRLVGADGVPVRADQIATGSLTTVFPEGHPGSAEAQTLLIHVEPERLQLPPERLALAPQGFIALSKLCTHAGCPVGLYRAETAQLICPCHQSTFDVLRGAVPSYGPAARPLPQLPIQLQPDGTFIALGDYPEPVGPSFWNMTHG